jgi:hypothetical protein
MNMDNSTVPFTRFFPSILPTYTKKKKKKERKRGTQTTSQHSIARSIPIRRYPTFQDGRRYDLEPTSRSQTQALQLQNPPTSTNPTRNLHHYFWRQAIPQKAICMHLSTTPPPPPTYPYSHRQNTLVSHWTPHRLFGMDWVDSFAEFHRKSRTD